MKTSPFYDLYFRLFLFLKIFIISSLTSLAQNPNIILIVTDQQRWDAVGYVGNSKALTPNLDELAKEGVHFTNAYSSTPSCTPARAALLTGMSPWGHGLLGYGPIARQYPFEMPKMLKENGYYTYGIGKMHWTPQRTLHGFHGTLLDESGRVESDGFISDYRTWFKLKAPGKDPDQTGILWNEHNADVYQLEEHLHPDHWKAEMAVDFINNYKLDNPLFLKVSFARPHSPYDPPKRFLEMYEDLPIDAPIMGEWSEKYRKFPNEREAAFGDFGEEHAIKSRKHYLALVTFIDEQIGKIIQALKENDKYDNSLILFVSDHGDMLGDHHHWRKTYAYEGSSKVPMIVKPPMSFEWDHQLEKISHPVELRDILPTFLDVAGINKPLEMEGTSLLKLISDPLTQDWRSFIDLEHASTYIFDNYWVALTDGKMKYIWFFSTGEEQLFDLVNDQGETKNIANQQQHNDQLLLWRKRMIDHLNVRGESFVKDGQLVKRSTNLLFGPNYPNLQLSPAQSMEFWLKESPNRF
jgi:arylsulfatase